jgi:hypothetical protein
MHLQSEAAIDFGGQPLVALTPLYHFLSDAEELPLGNRFKLLRYSEDLPLKIDPGDIFSRHLQIYPPAYVLWQLPWVAFGDWAELEFSAHPIEEFADKMQHLFVFPAANLFRQLRLFKPGRLFAGETFVLGNPAPTGNDTWRTLLSQRASLMSLDLLTLPAETENFTLLSAEVPFFDVFAGALFPLLDSLDKPDCAFPQLLMALELFGRRDSIDNEVLYCLTALEGLLTSESNSELSYRLSLRVASLLGPDDESRKRMFKDMKDFYDVRSKIVHGSGFKLKLKHQVLLKQISTLREYLRRILLSIMALLKDGTSAGRLEQLFDEIVLDETLRKRVQADAAKYIHIVVPPAE